MHERYNKVSKHSNKKFKKSRRRGLPVAHSSLTVGTSVTPDDVLFISKKMKKIFTDCDIYEDMWFRELPPDYKLLWDYICRMCEYGIWKQDFKLANFYLGCSLDPQKALDLFNHEKTRIEVLEDTRWFIVDFCHFQYGGITESCPAHKPIFKFYRSFYPGLLNRVCHRVYDTLQDKNKKKQDSITPVEGSGTWRSGRDCKGAR